MRLFGDCGGPLSGCPSLGRKQHRPALQRHGRAVTLRSFSLLGLMEDSVVDIWPELFRCERAEIQQGVGQPALSNLCPGAVLGWVVGRGDSGCYAGSHNLGRVEGFSSRICARDYRSRHCIDAPLDKAAMPQRVVAAVLMQHARQNASTQRFSSVWSANVCQ